MRQYSKALVFIAACAGMTFFGVTMLSLGPILDPLNELVPGANALPSTMSIGILIGTILFGPIVDKFGYKWLLIVSSLMTLAGIQGIAVFKVIGWLHLSIFILGAGGGILNGLTNALVSDIYDDDKRGTMISFLGGFYCIGALLWTLINYFISDFHLPLNLFSCFMLIFIIFFFFVAFPTAKPKENVTFKKSIGLLKYPALIAFALVLFFQSGFEGASGSFTVSYLTNTTGIDNSIATLSMTFFTIGMLAGRIPLGSIMKRLREFGTLYLYLSVGLIGIILLTIFRGDIKVVYIAMALIGFGVGATYPVVLTFIGTTFSALSGTAFSIAMFIGLIGQYSYNKIAGVAFNNSHFALFPILLISAVMLMMVIVPIAASLGKKTEKFR